VAVWVILEALRKEKRGDWGEKDLPKTGDGWGNAGVAIKHRIGHQSRGAPEKEECYTIIRANQTRHKPRGGSYTARTAH